MKGSGSERLGAATRNSLAVSTTLSYSTWDVGSHGIAGTRRMNPITWQGHTTTKTKGGFGEPWRVIDSTTGIAVEQVFADIGKLEVSAKEKGYPTQNPLYLFERIINASSNPGDVVLGPFCSSAMRKDCAGPAGAISRSGSTRSTTLSAVARRHRPYSKSPTPLL